MIEAIKEVIEKRVRAFEKKPGKSVSYLTGGVYDVARELGISYDAANELVRCWIKEKFS
jgi:hypothetical protein